LCVRRDLVFQAQERAAQVRGQDLVEGRGVDLVQRPLHQMSRQKRMLAWI
jgi:hypothetical protein